MGGWGSSEELPLLFFSHKNPNNSHVNALTPKEIKKVGDGAEFTKSFCRQYIKTFKKGEGG